MPKTLDDLFNEEEARRAAEPVDEKAEKRRRAKAEAERKRHIALGWIDEDGNSLLPEETDDEDEEDDDNAL